MWTIMIYLYLYLPTPWLYDPLEPWPSSQQVHIFLSDFVFASTILLTR
jgi:hypothetical protein